MFLSKLRKIGVTNVIDIRLKLRDAFPDITTNQAADSLLAGCRRSHIPK
jgi:hypothetical protein